MLCDGSVTGGHWNGSVLGLNAKNFKFKLFDIHHRIKFQEF